MKSLPVAGILLAGAITTHALPTYDPFADASGSGGTSYALGANIVGQTNAMGQGWYQAGSALPSATISSGSLSYSGLAPSSGNSLTMTPQANVAARYAIGTSFGGNNSSIYYSFLMRVTDIGSTLGSGGGFIAGFNNTGAASQTGSPTVLGARTLIKSIGGGTGYQIGLSKASSTASDFTFGGTPTTFTTSDTVLIVAAYDFNVLATAGDDAVRMWINPSAADLGAASAPAATLTTSNGADMITSGSIQSFLFYDRANTLLPNSITYDELRIGTSWADVTPTTVPEPGLVALTGLALLAGVNVIRNRRA